MPTRPRPRLYRNALIIAVIIIAVLLIWRFDRYFAGAGHLSLFWVALLFVFGAGSLYLAYDMSRSGSFFYDDVNYRWRLRRNESPVAFRVVQSMTFIFGVGWIALSLAFVFLTVRNSGEDAVQFERGPVKTTRAQEERVQKQIERRLQNLQNNSRPPQ